MVEILLCHMSSSNAPRPGLGVKSIFVRTYIYAEISISLDRF